MRIRTLTSSAALGAAATLALCAPAAHATYDGEIFPSHADCSAAARADVAATRNTTADTATCERVPGDYGGDQWQITITPRPWLNQNNDDGGDPNDFAGGFMKGLTSGSSGN